MKHYFTTKSHIINHSIIHLYLRNVTEKPRKTIATCIHMLCVYMYIHVYIKKKYFYSENLMTKYGSWEKQNFDETMELVKSFSNHVGPEIILGDLNTGPFTPIQGNEGYFMGT